MQERREKERIGNEREVAGVFMVRPSGLKESSKGYGIPGAGRGEGCQHSEDPVRALSGVKSELHLQSYFTSSELCSWIAIILFQT